MAVITDYDSLQTAVGDYLARSDLTTFVPNFVQNCEAKLLRILRIRQMETALSGTVSSGVLAVPSDYLQLKYAYVDRSPIQWLEVTTAENIYNTYPVRSGGEIPVLIAREAGNFIFGPYPSNVSIKGVYYAKPDLLRDDSDGSNFLTDDMPDLLLYGSLLEAEPFIKNDPRVALWQTMYERALETVTREAKRERNSGGSLAVRVG